MKKLFFLVLLYAFSSSPIFSQSWTHQTSPITTDLNSAWASAPNVCWICGQGGVVLRTDNGGINWWLRNSGLAGHDFYTISAVDSIICCVGAGDGSIWRTSDRGFSWTNIPLTPTNPFLNVIHFFNNSNLGFAMGDPVGGSWKYYITTNGGLNWSAGPVTIPASGTEAGWNNAYCALDTSFILIGTNSNKILKGSFRGNWTTVPIPGTSSAVFAFNNVSSGAAYFGSGQIVYTTNGGANWINSGFTPAGSPYILNGVKSNNLMFLGTSTNIYMSQNNGMSWLSQLSLPASSGVYALSSVTGFISYACWAGTQGGKIYRYYDYLEIKQNNLNNPEEYSLLQNYPNPFNPTTTIKYSIPIKSFVTLNLYDVLGNQIKEVVRENQSAGNYIEEIDMSNYSSGIYYYTLETAGFKETKKMVLIK